MHIKKSLIGYLSGSVLLLLGLPGCGRLIDWGKCTFYQGQQVSTQKHIVEDYIRSAVIYDQLSTCAIFDALWLSDEVRQIYTDLYVRRHGKDESFAQTMVRRQLEENNYFIMFYVLSLYEIPLDNEKSVAWSVFLTVNDINYVPVEITSIELPYEYTFFFGKRFSCFKTPYVVKFNARDYEDKELITPQTKQIRLYLKSADKEQDLVWNINESGKVIPDKRPICPPVHINVDFKNTNCTGNT